MARVSVIHRDVNGQTEYERKMRLCILSIVTCLLTGCARDNPIRYSKDESYVPPEPMVVEIISIPPGANIEVNDDYIGPAPCKITIYKTRWHTFRRDTIIRALPVAPGHYVQTKQFAGSLGDDGDIVPKRILFDTGIGPAAPVGAPIIKSKVEINIK